MPVDRFQTLAHSTVGKALFPRVGLPQPPLLRRYEPGQPLLTGPAVVGAAPGGTLLETVTGILKNAGAELADAAAVAETTARGFKGEKIKTGALVFDATGIANSEQLEELWKFFSPLVRSVKGSGRVVVLGTTPELLTDAQAAVAQRGLEGFTRSLGKEIGKGSTVQLVLVAPGAEGRLESTLRFLLSSKSAFVSGQVVRISTTTPGADSLADWAAPLSDQVVVVTGASRGIGEAIARTLARDGAKVIGVDVPPLADDLKKVTDSIGGSSIVLDVTAPDAAAKIARHARDTYGKLDGIVHNAGITRDKKLANMKEDGWKLAVAVNLTAPEQITKALVEDGILGAGGRVVVTSSIAGISGNGGQTNYATSKAGLIGLVNVLAPQLAEKGITINAVAPGFIETAMTAAIPFTIREGGRRLSSMLQGGQPVDVAETESWFLSPASSGVTGNVVRVCGQALIGA
ncbi:3-oxoacyl-ACP reductase [Spongisporangium articulatum]|uniref:3-oxoacyl-ACP reductase n=1 Tax=Spongisporangium articulatum TaxID=3362603 RepID=A0ABW8AL55_9ACTN